MTLLLTQAGELHIIWKREVIRSGKVYHSRYTASVLQKDSSQLKVTRAGIHYNILQDFRYVEEILFS